MLRIIIVRPGATDFDDQGRIKGDLDIPLNESGNGQICKTATELSEIGIQVVFTSPCQAANETSCMLADKLGVKVKEIEQLANLNHGLWQGLLIDDVKARQPKVYRQWQEQPESVCPPEGEMVANARNRVDAFLERILKKYRDGCVAIVAPEPLATIVKCRLQRNDLPDLWKVEKVCGTWEVLTIQTDLVSSNSLNFKYVIFEHFEISFAQKSELMES